MQKISIELSVNRYFFKSILKIYLTTIQLSFTMGQYDDEDLRYVYSL